MCSNKYFSYEEVYKAPKIKCCQIYYNFFRNLQNFALTHDIYRGAVKSLARSGRKQARKHVRDARDFSNIEMRAVVEYLFWQGKAPKEIHAILTETLACFLSGRPKDLSAPLNIRHIPGIRTYFNSTLTNVHFSLYWDVI